MGTAGRSAPLRRTGSLLGLVGLELAAVLALHWLGRFQGLQIRWDEPAAWILSSPVQEVLGAVLRMVGLVMAYWLLASTVAYLLASLTRLPGAVRAVRWATLPVVRRVADHAVAVTLATSMVGGGTLGLAAPAAAQDRGGAGPPAAKPAAAAQATSSTTARDQPSAGDGTTTRPSQPAYVPAPAGQVPSQEPDAAPPAADEPAEPRRPSYVPKPAGQAPSDTAAPATESTERSESTEPTTTTTAPTTTTTTPTTTTPTTTTPTTTAPTTTSPTTTSPTTTTPTTTTPTTTTPTTAAPTTESTAASTTGSTAAPSTTARPPAAAAPAPAPRDETTSTAPSPTAAPAQPEAGRPEPPSYRFPAAGDQPARQPAREPSREPGGGPGGETRRQQPYEVKPGDNLWSIARKELTRARSGGSGEPSNREVADYWRRLIAANRDRLWSGDPDLIFPTEPIILPPVE